MKTELTAYAPYFRRYGSGPALPPSLAIVIPPTQPLAAGLEFARPFPSQEESLWIFGHGLTLRDWPTDWSDCKNVVMLELGALYPADEIAATSQQRHGLIDWFKHLGKDHSILLSCAYSRFLYRAMESTPLTEGIRELAKSTRVLCSDPAWAGMNLASPAMRLSARNFIKLVALTAGGLILSAARTAKDMWDRRDLMADLRRRRLLQKGALPSFWLTVHHEWARFNPHLIDSFGLAEKPPGILFQGDLLPGERDHFTLKRKGKDFYQGLGPLLAQLDQLHLDQLVIPESSAGTVKAMLRTCTDATRILWGMARLKGDRFFYSADRLSSWAKLLSMDLLRANLAREATSEAVKRSIRPGSVVINYGAQGAAPIAADLRLQESGVTTVDFCHGAGIEMQVPIQHTTSTLAAAWTEVDVQVLERLGHAAVAAGMPIRVKSEVRTPTLRPLNLLLASNYVHRDTAVDGFYPLAEFHHYLASLPDVLNRYRKGTFSYRWRPHPADSPEEIQKALQATSQSIELSTGVLRDDLEWADLVVTSMSSLFFEALLSNRPVFTQILPRFRATRYAQAIDPRRKFFLLSDCADQIAHQLGQGSPGSEPENLMRQAFFGVPGWPAGPDALWEHLKTPVVR